MRVFTAIPIPEAVHEELRNVQGRLRLAEADVKWVEPEQIHLTLKFLGEVDASTVSTLQQVMDRLAHEARPFMIQCAGLGGFPTAKAPRVIWVGVDQGRDEAIHLARQVEEAMAPLGFAEEERAFSPHLTLGRVRSPANRGRLAQLLEEERFTSATPFLADQILLIQSTLTPQGPRYDSVHASPFAQSS